MDHVGGHVDPLRVITRIPKGMEIWNLRNRLCRIIADYRTQTSLQEGCNNILKADCVHLNAKLFSQVRHCIRDVYVTENGTRNATWLHYNSVTGNSIPASAPTIDAVRNPGAPPEAFPEASGSEYVPEERVSLKVGFLVEDDSQTDYTDSMRFTVTRRQSSIDESRELLPSLIK